MMYILPQSGVVLKHTGMIAAIAPSSSIYYLSY